MSGPLQGILQPKGFPPLPGDWVAEWETYPSIDARLQIFSSVWKKKSLGQDEGHRALIIAHGIGEHGGRYLHFPHFLKGSIDRVVAPDHRGHGRSEGLRGHINRFTDYEDDFALGIQRLDEALKKQYGKSEIHVLGHSMGSLILMGALYRHQGLPIRSAAASSPLLGLKMPVPIIKRLGAVAMSRVWSNIQMNSGLDVSHLSHDREVVKTYTQDRLDHSKITPRLFMEIQDSMAKLAGRAESSEQVLAYPLLFLIPMDDPIVDPEAALNFYRRLKIRDKQLKTYPGFLHESFNEIGKERAFEDLESWIKEHSTKN